MTAPTRPLSHARAPSPFLSLLVGRKELLIQKICQEYQKKGLTPEKSMCYIAQLSEIETLIDLTKQRIDR